MKGLGNKKLKEKLIIFCLVVTLSLGSLVLNATYADAGYPVFVTNFMQLVTKYMQKLWDGVVIEMRSQWRQYVKDILMSKGRLDVRELISKEFFKVASQFTNNPRFIITQSALFGNEVKQEAAVNKFIKSYSPGYINFNDARTNPARFNERVSNLSILNAPAPVGEKDREKMPDVKKLDYIQADIAHQLDTQQMLTASSGLTVAEEIAKKYENQSSALKKWDSMYSDAVIKDIAKMLHDNLQIQLAMLRIMATSKLNDAIKVRK